MRRLIPLDADIRPSTGHGRAYSGVARGSAASPRARQKKTIVFLLAGSLWSLPCGSTVAAEPATSTGKDMSPASVAARIPDAPAVPSDVATPESWNLHGQLTFVKQYHPSFTSPYQGTNSLSPGRNGEATTDLTLFAVHAEF
jgi:hypothetical protein